MGTVSSTNKPQESTPMVLGLTSIMIIWIVLCFNLLLFFYYRGLSESSEVEQIACPSQKLCLRPLVSNGFGYQLSVSFPSTIDGYEQGEQITIPYFKSLTKSSEKYTFTVTFDKNTQTIPSGGVKFMNLDGVGVHVTSENTMTVYIYGLSTYSTLDSFVPMLIEYGAKLDSSDLRKIAFFDLDSIPQKGINSLNLYIVPYYADVSADSLSMESSISTSTLLSGTNSVNFIPPLKIDTQGVVNVYDNYIYISKKNIQNAFRGDFEEPANKYTSCVDPGFIPRTCEGLDYDTDKGKWVDKKDSPEDTYHMIGTPWAQYGNEDKTDIKMCAWNLNPNQTFEGVAENASYYQSNAVADNVMENVFNNPDKKIPTLEWKYEGEEISGKGIYVQDQVFCGGPTNNSDNIKTGTPDRSQPQNAVWPNKANREDNFTSIGFN